MEPQRRAIPSSALRAGALLAASSVARSVASCVPFRVARCGLPRAACLVPLRAAPLLAIVALVALVAGCGSAAVTTTPSTPATSASPSASPSSALPVYDESIGGIYQIADVELEPGDDAVRLVFVAPGAAERPLVRLRPRAGAVDIEMVDARPLPAVVHVYPGGDGPITRGRFVFPPDDALVYFRLTLRGGATDDASSMAWQTLSSSVMRLAVTVSH